MSDKRQILPHNSSREKSSQFTLCSIIPKRSYVLFSLLIIHIIISAQFFVLDSAMEKILKDELLEYVKNFQWRVEAGYFLGYLIIPLISGLFVTKTGRCKETILFGILFSSISTLITPSIFESSVNSAIFVRALVGMGHSIAFGASFPLIYFWFPKQEYIRSVATMLTGYVGGNILGNFFSVMLVEDIWKSFFNWYGSIPILLVAVLFYAIVNHPSLHPSITQTELLFLRSNGVPHSFPPQGISIKKELSENVRIIFYIITQSAFLFANAAYLSVIPFFMNETIGLEYTYFGLLFFILVTVVFAMIVDFLINKIAMKNVREAVAIFGLIGSAITLRYFGTIEHLESVRLSAFIFSYSFFISSYSGHCSSILEISPKISAIVIGICLQFMVVGGMIAFPGMRFALDVSGAWSINFNLLTLAEIIGALSWIAFAYYEHKNGKWTSNILRE